MSSNESNFPLTVLRSGIGLIAAAGFIMAVMFVKLLMSFFGGVVFDYFMGTTLLPVFTIAGLVGIGLNFNALRGGAFKKDSVKKRKELLEKVYGSKEERAIGGLKYIALFPICSFLGALVANWVFPELSAQFLSIANYDGSIQTLAFWGGFTGAVIAYVKSIISLMIFSK